MIGGLFEDEHLMPKPGYPQYWWAESVVISQNGYLISLPPHVVEGQCGEMDEPAAVILIGFMKKKMMMMKKKKVGVGIVFDELFERRINGKPSNVLRRGNCCLK